MTQEGRMTKFALTVLFSLFLVSPQTFAAKLFLIGGSLEDNNASIFQALIKASGKNLDLTLNQDCSEDWKSTICPKIAVVTSGAENLKAGEEIYYIDDLMKLHSLSYQNLFRKWGMSPKHVRIAIDNFSDGAYPGNPDGDYNLDLIKNADIVFFNGGDQSRHAKSWIRPDNSDTPLLKVLRERSSRNEVIVSGTSAGTAIQGKIIYGEGNTYGYLIYNDLAPKSVRSDNGLRDDREGEEGFRFNNNGGMMTGFGFHPMHIAFDTHFEARGRLGRMIVAMTELKTNLGIGVDENTAVYLTDDTAYVYGQNGITFADGRIAKQYQDSKHFKTSNVRINVLTEGDQFNLKTLQVISNKTKITNPTYAGNLNSDNIFGAYQSQKLMNRLVHQIDDVNIGRSIQNGPGFEFQFKKDEASKGYFDNDKYTVENVIMDIKYF